MSFLYSYVLVDNFKDFSVKYIICCISAIDPAKSIELECEAEREMWNAPFQDAVECPIAISKRMVRSVFLLCPFGVRACDCLCVVTMHHSVIFSNFDVFSWKIGLLNICFFFIFI